MFSKIAKKSFRSPLAASTAFGKVQSSNFSSGKAPVRVAVTGGAGQIAYSLLFRVASGSLLGPDQPVILQLLDLPFAQDALKGVVMELKDSAFPLVHDIIATDSASEAFKDADVAMLVGAKPRGPGMERGDLLKDNGKIFIDTGKALNDNAARDCKVIVVGNPANTNCLIASHYAPDLPKENFTAMTRLDHNRALAQLADKTGVLTGDIAKMAIWGNHSPTMYPDHNNTLIKGQAATELVDDAWVKDDFIPTVQQRGAAIIKARGASSAASAASSAVDHIRDWIQGTNGEWVSMAVPSDGSYNIPEGLIFSYPVTCDNGKYEIVKGLEFTDFGLEKLENTKNELLGERAAVEDLLN